MAIITLLSADRTLETKVDAPRKAHFVNGNPIEPPFPDGMQQAVFGMGCFWGAERLFWQTPGVYSTAVAYAGGDVGEVDYKQV